MMAAVPAGGVIPGVPGERLTALLSEGEEVTPLAEISRSPFRQYVDRQRDAITAARLSTPDP